MKIHSCLVAASAFALALVASASVSRADVLMSFNEPLAAGVAAVTTSDSVFIKVGYPLTPPNTEDTSLFSSRPFNEADAGATFTISSNADDSNWSTVVAKLTDGLPLDFGVTLNNGDHDIFIASNTEAAWAFGNWNDPRIDLHGYTIDSISMTLNSLSIQSPGSNPARTGLWTDYAANVSVTVNGHLGTTPTPEPASCFIVLTALPLLARRRKTVRGASIAHLLTLPQRTSPAGLLISEV